MIRVKVYGPSVTHPFGSSDTYVVEAPTSVTDKDGVLIVITPGSPERPHPYREGKVIPALRSRQIIYPRGGWTKVVIDDVVDARPQP